MTLYGPLPVDDGHSVAIDTVVSRELPDLERMAERVMAARGGSSDLVLVAVPAGDGVTTQAFLRRALQIEYRHASEQERRPQEATDA